MAGVLFDGSPRGIGVWDVASGLPACDFLETGEGEIKMIRADGRVFFTQGTQRLYEMDLPPSAPAPTWLASRAQATGGWKMLDGGSMERVPQRDALWRKAESAHGGGEWKEYFQK
jgi:hypothetical protein